jgi:hypothetical protein
MVINFCLSTKKFSFFKIYFFILFQLLVIYLHIKYIEYNAQLKVYFRNINLKNIINIIILNIIGTRRNHSWNHYKIDAKLYEELKEKFSSNNSNNNNNNKNDDTKKNKTAQQQQNNNNKKDNKKDWEEYYDASARAKYWFNKVTGEASWTPPPS